MRGAVIVGLALVSTTARADGFIEGDVGIAVPIGDDDYDNSVDNSIKLGVRVGTATKFGGIDLSYDFTPYSDELSDLFDVSIQRHRFLLGARYQQPINPKARFFVRAAGGLDLIHYNVSGSFLGVDVDNSETDAGIGLEFSGGVLFDIGKLSLGAKFGIPIAFHFNEDDPNDQTDADLDYTAVDFDFAFMVHVPF